jgi:TetR/AcrR family transcriptional regulator, cholesterol catabolism regulator
MNDELKSILTKVGCLYKKYGIKSVTMDDVSRELGISKKTLYQYVTDKNELVSLVIDLEIDYHVNNFDKVFNQGLNAIDEIFEVHKILHQMIREHNASEEYDLKKYYPDQYQKILTVKRDQIYSHSMTNLKKGKKEGLYRPEIKEEIIAKIQLIRILSTIDYQIFTEEELISPKSFLEVFVYHIRGIATDKGLKILENKLKEQEI